MSTFLALFLVASMRISYAHPLERDLSYHDNATSSNTPKAVMQAVIDAMGGFEALNAIKGFSYAANDIYRSSTLTQTYNLYSSDQSVASAGSQTLSFALDDNGIRSRIDRAYAFSEYWTWAFPDLQPSVNMSVVVQDTANASYACFVRGSNNFFSKDLSVAQGYVDDFLTDYLVHHTHQFGLPWLWKKFLDDATQLEVSQIEEPGTLKEYTVIEHGRLELKLLVDPKTHLPHAVRSPEHNELYGLSTSDVILSSWAYVSVEPGSQILMPHRFQTVYNSRYVLEDFLVDFIAINPEYPASYFEGRSPPLSPENLSEAEGTTTTKHARSLEYPRSEIHEFFESGLWGGPFGEMFNESDVVVEYPYPAFKNIMTVYVGYADYVQLLVEHKTGFIITDAPPHRSKIILSWLAMHRLDKNVTHVVPSHHHRDHAGGVQDYVRAGATLVVPSVAKEFYGGHEKVPRIETYDEDRPFVFKDGIIEFRSYWKKGNPHAEDWSFAVATPAHPEDDDPFVLFNADVVNPGTEALRWDSGAAREFMLEVMRMGVPRSALLVGAHGSSENVTSTSHALVDVARTIGLEYPDLGAKYWITRE